MSIKVEVPSYLQSYTKDMEVVEVNGSTVGECLDHLVEQFPAIENELFDKDGMILHYVDVYVNGMSAYPEELVKPVKDGDELYILYIISGG